MGSKLYTKRVGVVSSTAAWSAGLSMTRRSLLNQNMERSALVGIGIGNDFVSTCFYGCQFLRFDFPQQIEHHSHTVVAFEEIFFVIQKVPIQAIERTSVISQPLFVIVATKQTIITHFIDIRPR